MNGTVRALGATILFTGAGVWALLFHSVPWEYVAPHAIFYAVLVLNTFHSIRFFSPLTPERPFQTFIDLALGGAYVALALSIGIPVMFAFFATLLFILASAKYADLLQRTPHDATMRKKILIDLLGATLCIATLGLTLIGAPQNAAWILAVSFLIANAYLLWIRPMYRLVLK